AIWASRHSTWVPARATRCWICCTRSRKPAATNYLTSSPTAAPVMSPAATPTPPSPPKNSAGAPNSALKPCAPTPGAGSPTTPKATAKPPLCRAHPLRTRGGCSYGSGLGCGSVVGAPPTVRTGQPQSTSHSSPPSHPGRVLLRVGGGIDFVVGAPPRCEPGGHKPRPLQVPLRTRGRHAFAPGASAPTGRRGDGLFCRSTAPVRTGAGTHPPHPPPA